MNNLEKAKLALSSKRIFAVRIRNEEDFDMNIEAASEEDAKEKAVALFKKNYKENPAGNGNSWEINSVNEIDENDEEEDDENDEDDENNDGYEEEIEMPKEILAMILKDAISRKKPNNIQTSKLNNLKP